MFGWLNQCGEHRYRKVDQLGQTGRIIAAVVVMGSLLMAAAIPLVEGLGRNARLISQVSEELVPTSTLVEGLVRQVLHAQSALEASLISNSAEERQRFNRAVENVHKVLSRLESLEMTVASDSGDSIRSQVQGVRQLVDQLETQAQEVFALSDRPDNVIAAHLINTLGEELLGRTNGYVDSILEFYDPNATLDDGIVLASLAMGFQDSLNRMMGSVRGYLFMKEPQFQKQYQTELLRNGRIYASIRQQVGRYVTASEMSVLTSLNDVRGELIQAFQKSFVERDKMGWRQDLDYYQFLIVPTVESLKWLLFTLSDSTAGRIAQVSADTMEYGQDLKRWASLGALLLLLIGGALSYWIYRCVQVFARQIGSATEKLSGLSGQLRNETHRNAREAGCQVEEIGGVHRTLNEFKVALSKIREQTEIMAQQTDSASLECVQGMEVLSDSQERMGAILTQAREISQAMEETKNQTKQMDGILTILDELVDQTKLLSFNATIEAAGAGKAGTRFAVVAKHVRRLATRAQEATQEIRIVIKKVQETTEDTRKAAERGTRAVNEGEDLMNVVTDRLDVIVGAVGQVSDVAGSIFLATQAQERSIEQVDRFTEKAADTAERVSKQSEESLRTAEALSETSNTLSQLVGK